MTDRQMRIDSRYDDWPADGSPALAPKRPPANGLAVVSFAFGLLSLFPLSVLSGLPAVVVGGLGLRAVRRSGGAERGGRLATAGMVMGGMSILLFPVLCYLTWPAPAYVWQTFSRNHCAGNLKQISAGMQGHLAATGAFPPAGICDAQGRRLLSWRVAVLPYIGQGSLYNRFNLDEPWDGPNNSQLLSQMPDVYALPGDTTAAPGYTFYRVFVSEPGDAVHAAFDWRQGARVPRDFPDGQSNTILVAEAGAAVPWTKPDELVYDDNGPLPPLGGHYAGGFHVVLVDGSVRFLPTHIDPQRLRDAITRDQGVPMSAEW